MLNIFPKDRKIRISTVAAIALLIIAAGIRTGEALFGGTPIDLFHKVAVPEAQSATTPQRLPEFTDLVTRLRPAVVNISTTQEVEANQVFPNPFSREDPFGDFWERFFGSQFPHGRMRQRSLGSGFIIDADGLILTNVTSLITPERSWLSSPMKENSRPRSCGRTPNGYRSR